MILSMTGYGHAESTIDDKTLVVEIRSLNSKLADVRIKTSLQLGQRELEIRRLVLASAQRGKIDVSIDLRHNTGSELQPPNVEMIKAYYTGLKGLADDIGVSDENLYTTILKLPNIFMSRMGS